MLQINQRRYLKISLLILTSTNVLHQFLLDSRRLIQPDQTYNDYDNDFQSPVGNWYMNN